MVDVDAFLTSLRFEGLGRKLDPGGPKPFPVVFISDAAVAGSNKSPTVPRTPPQGDNSAVSLVAVQNEAETITMSPIEVETKEAAGDRSPPAQGETSSDRDAILDRTGTDKEVPEARRAALRNRGNGKKVADGGSKGEGRATDDGKVSRGTDGASAVVGLAEENAGLRAEVSSFDLGFFEEMEDLKYSYARLKREVEKLAGKEVKMSIVIQGRRLCLRRLAVGTDRVSSAERYRTHPSLMGIVHQQGRQPGLERHASMNYVRLSIRTTFSTEVHPIAARVLGGTKSVVCLVTTKANLPTGC